MKQLKKYRKSFLASTFLIFSLSLLLIAGCQSKRARLLKETSWYSASVKWYSLGNAVNRLGGLRINTPSIWMGKVVKVEYNLADGNISNIYLEDAERLMPYAMFSKDLRLWGSKKNFNSNIPKVGEYWAFRVNRNIKGMMRIIKTVKLIYDLDADKLGIIDIDLLAAAEKERKMSDYLSKGAVVVLNGFQITDEKQAIIPARLKVQIRKSMTPREIVNKLGRGWLSKLSSAGIIDWKFSDGTVISIWYPKSLDKKVKVMTSKTYNVDEVNIILNRTMQQISSDLKKIKTKFPQLENIDSAKIKFNSFHYSKGWISDSKTKGVIFKKDGCDISFRVRYPAQSKDIQQIAGSPFLKISNGKYIQFWRLVRAENTEQGRKFTKEANKIITKNVSKMLDLLGHKRKDYVFELPKTQ